MHETLELPLPEKRLVIFGCGYVGAELARQAVARGLRVTAVTRNAAKAEGLRADGVEAVVADLAGAEWHGRIPGAADFAVNCVSSGGGGIEGYRRSYLEGMASVMRWGRAAGWPGTLVYTGSTSVYPQGDGAMVDETAPTDNEGERPGILVATEALLAAEMGGGRAGEERRGGEGTRDGDGAREGEAGKASFPGRVPRWLVLRLAGIYGPGRFHLIEQVRAGEIAGRGEHRLNLVHRDDIVAAVWAALTAPAEVRDTVFNVADDGAASKAEIVAWLAARLGVATPRFSGEPASGRRRITPDRVIANAKIKRVLGWRPRFPTFREGAENFLSQEAAARSSTLLSQP